MTQPYATPRNSPNLGAQEDQVRQRRKFWLRAIWVSIAGVIVPPIFGLIGTVIGMLGAFGELSTTGGADPEALAGDISVALLTTAWSFVLSVIALMVLVGVLIRFYTLPKLGIDLPGNSNAQQGAAPNR